MRNLVLSKLVVTSSITRLLMAVLSCCCYQNATLLAQSTSSAQLSTDLAESTVGPRKPDGDGAVEITGELKQWHKISLTMDGPFADENDDRPNPFLDIRMQTTFTHADGTVYVIPGFFAADGNSAETSASSGTKWRTHFAPDRTGKWQYVASIVKGKHVAIEDVETMENLFSTKGEIEIAPSDKSANDFRSEGRLQYVGKRYLQHMGSKKFFLKAGADAPETLLGYADFDNTIASKKKKVPLKTFTPHLRDWKQGDPVWQNDKGKGLIGAINYLSGKGCNAFSFLTYNAGGDGDNVWPFVQRDDKLHYDCSKLDQWGIVFDHGTTQGMYLHFKLQETENDDHIAKRNKKQVVPTALDAGDLGVERKLYLRELVARYAHNLALNWNLGEENTQSTRQQIDMINYLKQVDAYGHNIVVHTYPSQQDKVYGKLIGDQSELTGVSLQNSNIKNTHVQTVKWVRASEAAGRPWVVAFDESGSAGHGQCPDLGYQGFDGKDKSGKYIYDQHAVRRYTLWGALMGGGAGVEYYFGYKFVENDLLCEDWRSRDQSWDYCRICLAFFHDNKIPFAEMTPADELIGNPKFNNDGYCLAKAGEIYVVYLPTAGSTQMDLAEVDGDYDVRWFDPETGTASKPIKDATTSLSGGETVTLDSGKSDGHDVVAIIRRK